MVDAVKRVGTFAACAASVVLPLHACSADVATHDGVTNDRQGIDAGSRVRDEGRPADEDAAIPQPSVPEGWVRFDDYEKSCGLYIPSDRKYLPRAIEWKSCNEQAGPSGAPGPVGMVCQRMATDWEGAAGGQHLQDYNPARVGSDGKLHLLVRRFVGKHVLDVLGDADGGGVHHAILQTAKCLTLQPSLGPTHVIYGMIDDFKVSGAGGAIGGPIDGLRPKVYRPYGYQLGASLFPSFRAGDGVFVEDLNLDEVHAFDDGRVIASLPNQADDLSGSYTRYELSGQDVFFTSASSNRVTIKSWTVGAGTKTLIGKDNDLTRSSIGFGTDGLDMVWLEASERVGTSQIYAKQETWTAKYTTDPDVLAATKRRVRATSIEYGNVYKVGCGYAAVSAVTDSPWGKSGVRVIRLSDGVSWEILDNSEAQRLEWNLSTPVAVTCDEVFVTGSAWKGTGSRHYEIMRIRLDSLGPGTPPT